MLVLVVMDEYKFENDRLEREEILELYFVNLETEKETFISSNSEFISRVLEERNDVIISDKITSIFEGVNRRIFYGENNMGIKPEKRNNFSIEIGKNIDTNLEYFKW